MTELLVRDATLLTLDEADRIIPRGWFHVKHGRIAALGEGDAPPLPGARVIEAAGRMAVPGLVNAHTHSQSATMAGFGDRLSHPAFMWLTQAHTSRRTKEETRLAVLLTAWQALSTGTTALVDHFPGQRFTRDDLDAVLRAWEETGMRAMVALRFFDQGFDDIFPAPGVLPDALLAQLHQVELLKPQPLEELSELAEDAIRGWHGRHGRILVAPAPSNPDRCTDAALIRCAELAARHDTPLHTHLLETEKQVHLARARDGGTVVERMRRLGVLNDRWSCAHGCWLSPGDIALMAESGAIVALNPESNARIGAGTASIPALRAAGVRLALATDGVGANDNLSMPEAMRAAATLHRVALPRAEWMPAREALRIATQGGAAALRLPKLGALAPGWAADFALWRLDSPAFVPLNDPVAQLVFAATGAEVETVVVDGEVLLDGGRPVRFDAAALAGEIRDMTRSLRRRNADLFAAAHAVAERVP